MAAMLRKRQWMGDTDMDDFDFPIVSTDEEMQECEEQAGWPGDGSGMDDLADYNANEANDYANE